MTTATPAETTAHIWVGFLVCDEDAGLIGGWFNAMKGDDITLADAHGGAKYVHPDRNLGDES